MNKNELISYYSSSSKLTGDELAEKVFNTMGLKLGIDDMYKVRVLELFALVFGSISTVQLYNCEVPYEYDEDDPDVLYRCLSRDVKAGLMEGVWLKKSDNNIRHLYGLTDKGYKKITSFIEKNGGKNIYPLRKTLMHEYGLGLAIMSLFQAGMDFQFVTEVVTNNDVPFFNDLRIRKGSLRSDAVVNYEGGAYFIEQDTGSETIAKVGSKIKSYRDIHNKLIFTFHRPLSGKMLEADAVMGVRELSKSFPDISPSEVLIMIDDGEIEVSAKTRDALSVLYSVTKADTFNLLLSGLSLAKDAIIDNNRLKRLDDFKEKRMKNLFTYIIDDKPTLDMVLAGMDIYCHASELLSFSSAFYNRNVGSVSDNVFRKVLGSSRVMSYDGAGRFNGAVTFSEYSTLSDGTFAYMEYVEDNLGGLVRAIYGVDSVAAAGDTLILNFRTTAFALYVAEMLCSKRNTPGNNIFMYCQGTEKVYRVRFSKLIPVS